MITKMNYLKYLTYTLHICSVWKMGQKVKENIPENLKKRLVFTPYTIKYIKLLSPPIVYAQGNCCKGVCAAFQRPEVYIAETQIV